MILAKIVDFGNIEKKEAEYVINILGKSFTLGKEKWLLLAQCKIDSLAEYLKNNHPEIKAAVKDNKSKFMPKLLKLIEDAYKNNKLD